VKPDNIHREVLPTFVPQHIQDNVELCYLKLEQHGWFPLANVDPEGSYGEGKKEHPSYAYWYEQAEDYNEEGAAKFKDSPRLYNYNKREKQKKTPLKPDSTRALGEYRHWRKKVSPPLCDKVTKIDSAVGRSGWRAHVTLGNGVVRWTDDVFDWQQSNMLNPKGVMENGKSMYIYPNELEPMYSSFSPDKIYRWRPPSDKKKGRKRVKKKMTKEEIVQINDIRRQNMETRGSVNACKPSPRKTATVRVMGNQESDNLLNSFKGTGVLRLDRVLDGSATDRQVFGGLRQQAQQRTSPTETKNTASGFSTLTSRSESTPRRARFYETDPGRGGGVKGGGEGGEEGKAWNRTGTPRTDNRQKRGNGNSRNGKKVSSPTNVAPDAIVTSPSAELALSPFPGSSSGVGGGKGSPKIALGGIPTDVATVCRVEDEDTVISNITGVPP
jgi:hypothetical protein